MILQSLGVQQYRSEPVTLVYFDLVLIFPFTELIDLVYYQWIQRPTASS